MQTASPDALTERNGMIVKAGQGSQGHIVATDAES